MRKGRTYRRRQLKTRNISLDHNPELIRLSKWIKMNGFDIKKKMKIAQFPNEIRGLMAMEEIKADDILMEIPFNIILTVLTLESDKTFMQILNHSTTDKGYQFNCQEVLSFYISYLKITKCSSYWKNYIDSLPMRLSMPYFTNITHINDIDKEICKIVKAQKQTIHESYKKFKNIVDANQTTQSLEFNLEIYEWAYFIVNSRCIYIDPDVIRKIHYGDLLQLISDEPKLGLIPYLDMFNHSHEARTEIDILYNKIENLSDVTFQLKTLNGCKKYDQIYISYGNHGSLKLYTEYGFCLPYNPHTKITLEFKEMCNLLKICSENYKYIMKHKLNEDCYVTQSGYSINLRRLLFIISSHDKSLWDRRTYDMDYTTEELYNMNSLGNMLLQPKLELLRNQLHNFKYEKDRILGTIVNLFEEYIRILTIWIYT